MHRIAPFLAAAAFAAPASAAPFGELPFTPVAGIATCVRATGAPGELVRWTPGGLELLQAGPAGLAHAGSLSFDGRTAGCPRAAAQPGGAGVVAMPTTSGGRSGVWVALRDPGGSFGAPERLTARRGATIFDLAVAVSERGDAVVAWTEIELDARAARIGSRVRIARRLAGGRLGAPQELAARRGAVVFPRVNVGIGVAGEAVAAWTSGPDRSSSGLAEVDAAIAPPGGAFGAARRLGASELPGAPALAVAPDGRALAAFASGPGLRVAERAPGAGFGAATLVPGAFAIEAAVALRAGGGAVVAWRGFGDDVSAVVRDRPGPFGPAVRIAGEPPGGFGVDSGVFAFTAAEPPVDLDAGALRLALAGDGRAVLTWAAPHSRRAGSSVAPLVAALSPAGDPEPVQELGGPLRDADAVVPVVLPGGAPAVAWADNRDADAVAPGLLADGAPAVSRTDNRHADAVTPGLLAGGAPAVAWADNRDADAVTPGPLACGAPAVSWTDNPDDEGGGRLHIALEGVAPAPDPPAPRVRVERPRRSVLRADEPLVLPVTCAAACDVRAEVLGHGVAATLSLARAGTGRLRLGPASRPLAPRRRGPVRVRVLSGAPGARSPLVQTVTLRLRGLPRPPPPRVLDLRARRHGGTVEVTWRTDVPARGVFFAVEGHARASRDSTVLARGGAEGNGRRRFHVTLRRAARVRWVTVSRIDPLGGSIRETTVRVG